MLTNCSSDTPAFKEVNTTSKDLDAQNPNRSATETDASTSGAQNNMDPDAMSPANMERIKDLDNAKAGQSDLGDPVRGAYDDDNVVSDDSSDPGGIEGMPEFPNGSSAPAPSDGYVQNPTPTPSAPSGTPSYETMPGFYEAHQMALVQTGPKPLDVLFVVDSSGSMSEEQSFLSQNFSNFIAGLQQKVSDFQVAVTTTDICLNPDPVSNLSQRVCPGQNGTTRSYRGGFVGTTGRKVLKSTDSDLVTKFGQYALVGTNGSGFEHGLGAAQLSVQKVLSGANEPLIRSNAFLSVIVISDEEDDGWGLTRMVDKYTGKNYGTAGLTTYSFTDTDFTSYMSTVKGNQYAVSTITGTKNADGTMCRSAHSQPEEEGGQYIRAANATGGVVQSICDSDWNNLLNSLGRDLGAQITQVALEGTPDPATIHVFVNSVEVTGWQFVAGNDSVKFDPAHLPAPGDQIRIDYMRLKN